MFDSREMGAESRREIQIDEAIENKTAIISRTMKIAMIKHNAIQPCPDSVLLNSRIMILTVR